MRMLCTLLCKLRSGTSVVFIGLMAMVDYCIAKDRHTKRVKLISLTQFLFTIYIFLLDRFSFMQP